MKKVLGHITNILAYLFRKERIRPTLICLAALCFVWFAIFGNQGLYDLHKSNELRDDLKNLISKQTKQIEELEKKKRLLNNPAHLELVIRQELGYVKTGETVFQPAKK